ncbi:MAG: hypothetical protein Tsb0021_18310 [Chlamydiales bacterium]
MSIIYGDKINDTISIPISQDKNLVIGFSNRYLFQDIFLRIFDRKERCDWTTIEFKCRKQEGGAELLDIKIADIINQCGISKESIDQNSSNSKKMTEFLQNTISEIQIQEFGFIEAEIIPYGITFEDLNIILKDQRLDKLNYPKELYYDTILKKIYENPNDILSRGHTYTVFRESNKHVMIKIPKLRVPRQIGSQVNICLDLTDHRVLFQEHLVIFPSSSQKDLKEFEGHSIEGMNHLLEELSKCNHPHLLAGFSRKEIEYEVFFYHTAYFQHVFANLMDSLNLVETVKVIAQGLLGLEQLHKWGISHLKFAPTSLYVYQQVGILGGIKFCYPTEDIKKGEFFSEVIFKLTDEIPVWCLSPESLIQLYHHQIEKNPLKKEQYPVSTKSDMWSVGMFLARIVTMKEKKPYSFFSTQSSLESLLLPYDDQKEDVLDYEQEYEIVKLIRDLLSLHKHFSPKTDLERLIADLLNPDPDKRPDATATHQRLMNYVNERFDV